MKKLHLSAFLGVVTVLALVAPTWAAGDGSITFGQSTVNIAVGQSFTLDVNFNTGSNQVGVITAEVQFDESVLTLDIPNITHVGSPLAIYPPVVVDQNDAGHVTITGAAFGDANPTAGTGYQGQGLLATLPFTLTAAPSGDTTSITLGSGSSILIDDDNGTTNTLGNTNQVTVNRVQGGGQQPNQPTDTTPPVISAIQGTVASNTSLTITWTTNENTTGTVDYGVSTSLGQSVQSTTTGTAHSVTLSNLIAGTKYYFKITSKDTANNTSSSALQNVTTSGTAPIGGGGTNTGGSTNNTTGNTNKTSNTATTNKTGNSILAPKTGAGTLITVVVVIGLGLAAGAVYFYLAQRSNAAKNQQPPKANL